MTDRITFRPAQAGDFEFCQRLYLEGMGWIIERSRLAIKRQYESFANQRKPGEVRVIVVAGEDAGWLQNTPAEDDIFSWPALSGKIVRRTRYRQLRRAVFN